MNLTITFWLYFGYKLNCCIAVELLPSLVMYLPVQGFQQLDGDVWLLLGASTGENRSVLAIVSLQKLLWITDPGQLPCKDNSMLDIENYELMLV